MKQSKAMAEQGNDSEGTQYVLMTEPGYRPAGAPEGLHLFGLLIGLCVVTIIAVATVAIATSVNESASSDAPLAVYWGHGPNGLVWARAIVGPSVACPSLTEDGGGPLPVTVRAEPSEAFPVRVCEGIVTGQNTTFGGVRLQSTPNSKEFTVVGDTGCRADHKVMQSCNDAAAWPWASIASAAAQEGTPALVLHVGDYNYLKTGCDPAKGNCSAIEGVHGDTWSAWHYAFFGPARPLLHVAPWIFVRGNHEICSDMGTGYFLFFGHSGQPIECQMYMGEPYKVAMRGAEFYVMDASPIPEFKEIGGDGRNDRCSRGGTPGPIRAATCTSAPTGDCTTLHSHYTGAFNTIAALMNTSSGPLPARFLTSHQPLFGLGCCQDTTPGVHAVCSIDPVLQGALNPTVLASTLAHFSGHAHFFQATLFKQRRFPHQFIVGNSGTALYSWSLLPGAVVNQTVHLPPSANVQGPANEALVRSMTNMIEFGYGVVQHDDGTGWRFSLRSPAGEEVYATTIQ